MVKLSDVLAPLNMSGRICKYSYSGAADTFIVYTQYNEVGEAYAENEEIETSKYLQVDIYSKDDVETLYQQVLALMTAAGFYRIYSSDDYDSNTKQKRKIIRFQYCE